MLSGARLIVLTLWRQKSLGQPEPRVTLPKAPSQRSPEALLGFINAFGSHQLTPGSIPVVRQPVTEDIAIEILLTSGLVDKVFVN